MSHPLDHSAAHHHVDASVVSSTIRSSCLATNIHEANECAAANLDCGPLQVLAGSLVE